LEKSAQISGSSFFAQNLLPGDYLIVVAKSGYWSWAKHISVLPKEVGEASPFILPQHPVLRPITETLATSNNSGIFNFFTSSTTADSPNPEYSTVSDLFASQSNTDSLSVNSASSTSTLSTAPTNSTNQTQNNFSVPTPDSPLIKDNVSIWAEGSTIYAQWLGDPSSLPISFCAEATCKNIQRPLAVFTLRFPLLKLQFFPGRNDVLLFQNTQGIYAIEIDRRDPQNLQPLYLGQNLDFVVDNDRTIYLKKGNDYFEVQI
jgi:hypothetical protein